jgi:hypothetical protein
MRFAALLAASLVISPAFAADIGYLFDALAQRPYRAAWDKLMKEVQPTPDWLVQFNRNFDGASGQMISLTVEGKPYELSFVCKPSDCGSRKFAVLFDAGAQHAFGALGGRGEPPAFYGRPTPAEQDALAKALKG